MNKNNWTYKKLGEVCKVTMGQSPNGNSVNDTNGIEFHQGKVSFGEKYLNVSNSFTEQPSKIAEPNSVLLCVRAPVGTVNITPRRICIGRGLCSIQPNDIIIMPFLFYALTQKQAYFDKNSTGSTFKAISSKVVINTILPIPPLADQERIVAELDLLSSIIEKKKAQLKELDQLAQSIFYNMFGDPITNEKGWEVKKLGEVVSFINGDRGKNYPSQNDFVEKGIPFINAGHLCNGSIDFESMNYINEEKYNILNSGKIKEKDILFCLRGSLGKRAIVTNIKRGAIASSLVIMRSESVSNQYLFHYLGSSYVSSCIQKSNNGSSQPNLSAKSVSAYLIPLPPLPLQQEFADKVEAIERQKTLIQQSIDEVQTMFDSRMDYWFG